MRLNWWFRLCVGVMPAVLAVVVVSAQAFSDDAGARSRIAPLREATLLVEAQVVAVDTERDERGAVRNETATVRITKVFFGPRELVGADFGVYHSRDQISGPPAPYPTLRTRETGLWLLVARNNRLDKLIAFEFAGRQWPVRKGISPRYEDAVRLAEAVQKVAETESRDAQLQSLREYAVSRVPDLSAWAIARLRQVATTDHDEPIAQFLRRLTGDERLTVAGQVALDESLLKLDADKWQHSAERLDMLRGWMRTKLSEEDEKRILWRVSMLAQHAEYEGLEQRRLMELVRVAATSDNRSLAARMEVIRTLTFNVTKNPRHPEFPARYDDDTPSFELLVELIKTAKAPQVRLTAAQCLRRFLKDGGEGRRRVVTELRNAVRDDEDVSNALTEVLK